jgi:serine/threonine-protein kinase
VAEEERARRAAEKKVEEQCREIEDLQREIEEERRQAAGGDGWAHVEVWYLPPSAQVDFSRFDLSRMVGQGSYSRIYEATDKKAGKRVAVKQTDLINLSDDWRRPFFVHEFLVPMALKIPSAVKVLGYCLSTPDHNTGEVVMEFMANGTLADALRVQFTGRPMPGFGPTELTKAIFGVAAAMEQLHAIKIAHRDLVPRNVLLDDNWEPRLAGFDYSESVELELPHSELEDAPCGVLSSSPELLLGEDVASRSSPLSDVYAFAVFMYMSFTPKETELEDGPVRTPQNLKRRIVRGARLKRQPGIPDKYWELIQKCWDPIPANRPTFTEIVRAMRASTDYAIEGTDVAKYQEYQARVCAGGAGPLATGQMLNHLCEKILAGWPGS